MGPPCRPRTPASAGSSPIRTRTSVTCMPHSRCADWRGLSIGQRSTFGATWRRARCSAPRTPTSHRMWSGVCGGAARPREAIAHREFDVAKDAAPPFRTDSATEARFHVWMSQMSWALRRAADLDIALFDVVEWQYIRGSRMAELLTWRKPG